MYIYRLYNKIDYLVFFRYIAAFAYFFVMSFYVMSCQLLCMHGLYFMSLACFIRLIFLGYFKVRKRATIRNRYNQAPHLTQDTNGKVTTSQLDIKNDSQEVSPFPAAFPFLIQCQKSLRQSTQLIRSVPN